MDFNQIQNQQKIFWNYLEILRRRKWWLIISFLIAIGTGAFLSVKLPKEYQSTTMILVERQQIPENYIRSTVTSTINDRLKTIQQQVMSRTNLAKLIEDFELYKNKNHSSGLESVIGKMRSQIELKVVGREAISLSYSGKNPTTVKQVTEALASKLIEENLKVREEQAKVTSEFLGLEVKEAKKQLDQQDKSLKEFKEKYMGGLPQQLETNLRTLDRLQIELQLNNDQLKTGKEKLDLVEKQLLEYGNQSASRVPGDTSTQLLRLKKELVNLQGIYKENYPDVILLKERIQKLEQEIANDTGEEGTSTGVDDFFKNEVGFERLKEEQRNLNNELSALKLKRARLTSQIKEYEQRVEKTPRVEEEQKILMRDYTISQNNYQILLKKSIDARISENRERRQKGEKFRILDPPNLPKKPYKPNVPFMMLGSAGGGIGLGVVLAFIIEFFNPCFRKPEDFEEVIPFPVLASIPELPQEKKKRGKNKNIHFIYGKKERLLSRL